MLQSTMVYCSQGTSFDPAGPQSGELRKLGVEVLANVEHARALLASGSHVISVFLTSGELQRDVRQLLIDCASRLAGLVHWQVIVCDDPSAELLALAHELGFRNFWPAEGLVERVRNWVLEQEEVIDDSSTSLGISLRLGVALARRRMQELNGALPKIREEATSDFRLAHLLGHLLKEMNDPENAEVAFAMARNLNASHLPSIGALGTAMLSNGKSAEALALFEELEAISSGNFERKVRMAHACMMLNKLDRGEKYLDEAQKLEPESEFVHEAQALFCFHKNEFEKGMKMLRLCRRGNADFISRLNVLGIQYSHEGRFAEALELYAEAHRLAPPVVKHKVSFNIALAYKRKGDIAKAFEAAEQADSECHDGPTKSKIGQLLGSLRYEEKLCV